MVRKSQIAPAATNSLGMGLPARPALPPALHSIDPTVETQSFMGTLISRLATSAKLSDVGLLVLQSIREARERGHREKDDEERQFREHEPEEGERRDTER